MYNQHTRGMVTTRHRCLVGRGERKTFIEDKGTHTEKKCQEKPIEDGGKMAEM